MNRDTFDDMLNRFGDLIVLASKADTIREKRVAMAGLHDIWTELAHDRYGDPLDPKYRK